MHHESRKGFAAIAVLFGALTLGACEQELPTSVGGDELPEASLRTYEVVLDGSAFLERDTLVAGFGAGEIAPLLFVAEDWLDTLDAHALVRFREFPKTLTFVDSTAVVTDSVIAFVDGRLVMRIDTASLGLDSLGTDSTIAFEIYQLAEGFDARSATWTARRAVLADTVPWTTPGGTVGDLIGAASWVRSDTIARDSLVFALDSATIAAWMDGGEEARSLLIRTTTPGARVPVGVRMQLNARLKADPDTTRAAIVSVEGQTVVFDPPTPEAVAELRVGERPAWRSFLVFAAGLDTLSIPCPGGPAGCSFRLGDATLNRAELHLTPLDVSPAWRTQSTFLLEVRRVLGGETRPLERTPLSDTTGVALVVPADLATEDSSVVRVGVTWFVNELLVNPESVPGDRDRMVALLTSPEPITWGIARFGGVGTAAAPVLRLIVTLPPAEEEGR